MRRKKTRMVRSMSSTRTLKAQDTWGTRVRKLREAGEHVRHEAREEGEHVEHETRQRQGHVKHGGHDTQEHTGHEAREARGTWSTRARVASNLEARVASDLEDSCEILGYYEICIEKNKTICLIMYSIMVQIAKSKLIEYLIWKDGHYRWSFKIFRKLKSWREIVFFNWNCVINEGTYIGEKRYSTDRLPRALSIIFYNGFFYIWNISLTYGWLVKLIILSGNTSVMSDLFSFLLSDRNIWYCFLYFTVILMGG